MIESRHSLLSVFMQAAGCQTEFCLFSITDLKQSQDAIYSIISTMLWYLEIKKPCKQLTERKYIVFHTGEYRGSDWQFKCFHAPKQLKKLKTTKPATKLQKPASPNPAGRLSAACHETSSEFAGFWYLNKTLQSSTLWNEQYIQRAMLSVTDWVKFEISVYGSCAYTEGCQHVTLDCVQKHSEEERGNFLLNSRQQRSLSQIKWLPNAILSLNISFDS